MRFELLDFRSVPANTAAIRRLTALGIHWRVMVEAWPVRDTWTGRLIFTPDQPAPLFEPRQGPIMLRGGSRAEVLEAAHDIPERRLRALLHSLA